MSDKFKTREILVCPVKLFFYYENWRETTKWCVFQEKTWISDDIIFAMPLGIVGDLH